MVKPSLPLDIYIRVSRVGNRGDRLISPDDQERRAREHAAHHGLRVGTVLPPDLDESGGKLDRPGLNEALRRVEAGESGGIIVAWLDRLSRDSEHAHALVRRITDAGGVIYAPDAPSDWTSPEGDLQAGIMFAFAQYVRKRAGAGFERAKKQAVERGIPVNARAPVGYVKSEDDRRHHPDPDIAPIIREVFERRSAGAGPGELGELLQHRGVPTSAGQTGWSRHTVYRLLANPVYKGTVRYGRDDRYVNTNAHEAIVDPVLWQAAQGPTRAIARVNDRSEWLLTGILRCHACRYAMQSTVTHNKKRVYRCMGRHGGGTCPTPARFYADDVESAVIDAFWAITADRVAHGSRRRDHADLAALQSSYEKAEARVRQLQSPDAQDALGDAYLETFRSRRQERDQAAEDLGRARAERNQQRDALVSEETLRGAWDRASTAERRELLSQRLDCVAAVGSRAGERSILVYPVGCAPSGLPRRGFSPATLEPFPDAAGDAREVKL